MRAVTSAALNRCRRIERENAASGDTSSFTQRQANVSSSESRIGIRMIAKSGTPQERIAEISLSEERREKTSREATSAAIGTE